MPSLLNCLLLCALVGGDVSACTPRNRTIWIERHDCGQCVAVNTTICSGYCYTQDTNLKGRFGRIFLIQRSCVPLSLVYHAVCVPGCPQNVNPQLYYPAAHRCTCRRCDTRTHRCVRSSRVPHDQCPMPNGTLNQASLET